MSTSALSPDEVTRLVLEAKDGNTESFGKLYDAFFQQIYRYVTFRFPQDFVEDLVADIFVKAWEKLGSYTPRSGVPFSAWLFRIARHTVIDAYRTTRGFEELSEELQDDKPDNDPATRFDRSLTVSMVRHALSKLHRDYQDILLLHYVAGLGFAEIAEALRMTQGYVRIMKFRGLKKLEVLLKSDIDTRSFQ